MPDSEKKQGLEGEVSCSYCRKTIPASEAYHPEGEERVMHFCGLSCYQSWRDEAGGPRPKKVP